ncbi:putative oxidoreductase [subsurface metagenome]
MKSLKEKYALITGAGSGIGRAIAEKLGEEEVNLILLDRDTKSLTDLKNLADKSKVCIETVEMDISDKEKRRNIFDIVNKLFGKLDILIHCAGTISQSEVEATSDEDLDYTFQVNFNAPFILTRELLPLLKAAKGQILFINSSAVQRPMAKLSHYAASKHALKGFTDALREEVNSDSIRVISLYPGKTATGMQKNLYQQTKSEYKPELLIQPEDIASAVGYLLSMPQTVEVTDLYLRPMKKS